MAEVIRLDPYQNIVSVGWAPAVCILHAEFGGGATPDGTSTRSGYFSTWFDFDGAGGASGVLAPNTSILQLFVEHSEGDDGDQWILVLNTQGPPLAQPFSLSVEGGPTVFSADIPGIVPGISFFPWTEANGAPSVHLSAGDHRVIYTAL